MEDGNRTIGGLKVVRLIGKGGMSEVYEVEDPRLGSRHALKLFTYPKDDAEVRARFETEGRLLAKLSHPRIVKVTDIGKDEASGRPYFVMDLVLDPEGAVKTLGDVPDGGADEATVGMWYDDVRDGLAYIHANGVVHRDLKLQNIMIGPDGHAVIADFGVSRIFNPAGRGDTVVDPVQTILRLRDGKNLVMGSIGYMAPEVEMGMPATPESDWFSLGVITYKLLTGIWCDAKTDIGETLETYDPVWKKIIPKLLHSNPAGRKCLSYAAEIASARDARELQQEERYLNEKRRGHLARHVARYAVAVSAILAVALAFVSRELYSQREVWKHKLEAAGARPSAPTFDELFKIPAEAKVNEQIGENGEVVMYSRSQLEAARIDALVLTHDTLSMLATGNVTIEKTISDFERLYFLLDEDSPTSPFDNLSFGGNDWFQFGESGPLRMLFERAIEKLKLAAEE